MASCNSVFIATSLDGYIARPDGAIDWLPDNEASAESGEDYGYYEFIAGIDALVMGRASLEKLLASDSWPYEELPVYVLSSTLRVLPPGTPKTVTLLNAEPAAVVQTAQINKHPRLYIDGGITIQRFLAEGLVTDMVVTTIPVLLGSGRRLFGTLSDDVKLELVYSRAYPNGLVQTKYTVCNAACPSLKTRPLG
jgi:dihydrofolate reductase